MGRKFNDLVLFYLWIINNDVWGYVIIGDLVVGLMVGNNVFKMEKCCEIN